LAYGGTPGICSINADQAGNSNFTPAPTVTRTFTVNLAISGDTYHPITPIRLIDSRIPMGLTRLQTGVPQTFAVTGQVGIPSNAVAISANAVSVGSVVGGYFAFTPVPTAHPGTSSLNFPAGDIRANNLIIGLGAGGTLSVVYIGGSGGVDIVLDINGYFTADASGDTYHAMSPVRVVDSRINLGLAGALQTGVPKTFAVAGVNGIPSNAVAVTGNLVTCDSTGYGYFALTTTQTAHPATSTLNFPRADIRANGVVMPLTGGGISVVYIAGGTSTSDIVFDVTGYFTADGSGVPYHVLSPVRLVDSRLNYGLSLLHTGVPQSFAVAGQVGVPSGSLAVTGNLTTVDSTGYGYFALTTAPTAHPATSTLNFPRADIRANGVVMTLSGGNIDVVYISYGTSTSDIVFDVTGYFK
jgi:hypothetical protein